MDGLKRFLLGSVSDRILQSANRSVLIAKRPEPDSPEPVEGQRIIVGCDDSAAARLAVESVAALPLDDTVQVRLVGVLTLLTMFRQDIRQKMSWVWQERKAAAREALQQAREQVEWTTPHVTTELTESGSVYDALMESAADFQASLVVLGDKGKTAAKKFVVGSVTGQVARRAACSVWVVRKKFGADSGEQT